MEESPSSCLDPQLRRASFLDRPVGDCLGFPELLSAAQGEHQDVGLRFYVEVLGLEHLHYGLWTKSDPLTLEGLRAAQERYLDHLLTQLPAAPGSVLDVGCGAGGNSKVLMERGYEVEGLSPDPFHGERFREATGRPFHLAKFQDFRAERRFDIVFMSESAQYVPLDRLFDSVATAVEPGGCLLLSDYFVLVKDGTPVTKSGHLLDDFLAAATNAGFRLDYEEDITEQVLPSLALGGQILDELILPGMRLVLLRLSQKRPRLVRFVLRRLRSRLAKLEKRKEILDPDLYRRKKRYMIYRFQAPS